MTKIEIRSQGSRGWDVLMDGNLVGVSCGDGAHQRAQTAARNIYDNQPSPAQLVLTDEQGSVVEETSK